MISKFEVNHYNSTDDIVMLEMPTCWIANKIKNNFKKTHVY